MRRTLNATEKQEVLQRHGMICYVNGHPIESEADLEFHHIEPYSLDGETTVDNMAPVCKAHHHKIGLLSLEEYRDRLALEEFFEQSDRHLDDVLESKFGAGHYGLPTGLTYSDGSADRVKILYSDGRGEEVNLYVCPATGARYFYSAIPLTALSNDEELQPRPLDARRVWDLCSHLRRHTQLAPSVARWVDNKILLFDGQHKAAAQAWIGRRAVDCKVYVEPDLHDLKDTNLAAHDRLRQMAFYTSTLIRKYADLFREDWAEYLEVPGPKTEEKFVRFMTDRKGLTPNDAVKRLQSAIYDDILDSPQNRLVEFIAERNRTRKNPLTTSSVQKSFFQTLLTPPPLKVEFESPQDFREVEKTNLVRVMSMVADEGLINKWNPEANDNSHHKAQRIFASGVLRGWVPILRDVISQVLRLYDGDERQRPLFRVISDEDFDHIKSRMRKLFSAQLWSSPDPGIDQQVTVNNAEFQKEFLREQGITAAWVLGAH